MGQNLYDSFKPFCTVAAEAVDLEGLGHGLKHGKAVAYGFGRALVDDTYLPGERLIIAPYPFIHIMPVKDPCAIIRFGRTGSGHCQGCLARAGLPHY